MAASLISKPFTEPRKILLWFSGNLPNARISVNSLLMPRVLWPNATIDIRCNASLKTCNWINNCTSSYNIIDSNIPVEKFDFGEYDIIWNHDYWFTNSMTNSRDQLSRKTQDINYIVYNVNKPIYFFYCDIDFLSKVTHTARLFPNLSQLDKHNKRDFSNITILFHQDILDNNYGNDRIDYKSFEDCIPPNVEYTSYKLFFNLPDEYVFTGKTESKTGGYFAAFHPRRITFFRKILNDGNLPKLDLKLAGRGVNELSGTKYQSKFDSSGSFSHEKVFRMTSECDWMLYIGRLKPISWAGSAFFIPFVMGKPILCYGKYDNDVANKIFGELDCWFATEKELHELLNRVDLEELFYKQITQLKKYCY